MGNLIERVHNVTQREERHQKKPKAEAHDPVHNPAYDQLMI